MFDKSIFQLCNTITEAEADKLDLSKYICQEKKDGTRVIAIIQDNNVAMINRRGKIVNYHFTDIENELKTFDNNLLSLVIGFIVSFIVSYFTLKWFLKLIRNKSFHKFAYYCFILGIIVVLFSL